VGFEYPQQLSSRKGFVFKLLGPNLHMRRHPHELASSSISSSAVTIRLSSGTYSRCIVRVFLLELSDSLCFVLEPPLFGNVTFVSWLLGPAPNFTSLFATLFFLLGHGSVLLCFYRVIAMPSLLYD